MNYKRIYEELINRSVSRGWTRKSSEGNYIEVHHILPRSMGGGEDACNKTSLTAREHFIAHWLLYKIHGNTGMACAWNIMSTYGAGKYTSKSFQYAREAFSKSLSERHATQGHPMQGRAHKEESILKISAGIRKYYEDPEVRAALSEKMKGEGNPFYGRAHSPMSKEAMRNQALEAGLSKTVQSICVNTGDVVEYESIKEASRCTGIRKECISRCCRGVYKTSGKRRWNFVTDEN